MYIFANVHCIGNDWADKLIDKKVSKAQVQKIILIFIVNFKMLNVVRETGLEPVRSR